MAEQLAEKGSSWTPCRSSELAEMALHDSIFTDIDLNWWLRDGH